MNARQSRDALLVATLLGVAYALLLALVAVHLGTWTDEEYTLATTAHGPAYAWARAIRFEAQAPMYFVLLALWRALDSSVLFARAFSLVCAIAFYVTVVVAARRFGAGARAPWIAFAVALNPFALYAAFDIRLYAFALVLGALGWLAFDAGFLSGDDRRARTAFVLIAVVATYTQYFLAFAFVGYGVALVLRHGWSALRRYAFAVAAVVIATIPLAIVVHSQIGVSGETTEPSGVLIRETLEHPWLEFAFPHDSWNTHAEHLAYEMLVIGLTLVFALARPRTPAFLATFAAAVTIEAVFVFVVATLRLDLDERHYVALFVAVALAGIALFEAFRSTGRGRAIAAVGACCYLGLAIFVDWVQWGALAQMGDTKRVAAFFEANAAPRATVAIFPADALPAYARQYRGSARLVPFPHALPTDHYDLAQIVVGGEAQARAALRGLPHDQTWLVMVGDCDRVPAYGCENVRSAIAGATRIETTHRFFGATVYELDVRRDGPRTAEALGQIARAREEHVAR